VCLTDKLILGTLLGRQVNIIIIINVTMSKDNIRNIYKDLY